MVYPICTCKNKPDPFIRNGVKLICLHPRIPTLLLGDPYIYRAGREHPAAASFALETRQFNSIQQIFDFPDDGLGLT